MSDFNERTLEETAQRFRDASRETIDWTAPAAGSWEGISAALGFTSAAGATGPSFIDTGDAAAVRATEPSGSAFPGDARTVAPAPSSGLSRRTVFAGIGGVVVGAVLGAGAMRLTQVGPAQSEPTPVETTPVETTQAEPSPVGPTPAVPARTAVLSPLDATDVELGVAKLRPLDVGYSLSVEVPEGVEHPGGYVEVWLIHTDLSNVRMVSVGVFAAGTDSEFYVSQDLIDQGYLIVDLSNEEFDTEPRHSADTVMRGELRA